MSRDWTEDEPLDKAAEMAARTVRAAGQAKQAAEAIQAVHLAAGAQKWICCERNGCWSRIGVALWERLLGRFWQVNPSGKR